MYGTSEKELYTNPTDAVLGTYRRYQAYNPDEDKWYDTPLPRYWKDCRTTGTVITGISYRYYGVKTGGTPEPTYADPITVLAKVEKPQAKTYDGMVTQNFAFDIDLEDYT